ncbi:hypothetical protein L1887_14271 [Cichorium endivia]|nr:hypothetical protein L1887_14271 [Cichorium endivia]
MSAYSCKWIYFRVVGSTFGCGWVLLSGSPPSPISFLPFTRPLHKPTIPTASSLSLTLDRTVLPPSPPSFLLHFTLLHRRRIEGKNRQIQ